MGCGSGYGFWVMGAFLKTARTHNSKTQIANSARCASSVNSGRVTTNLPSRSATTPASTSRRPQGDSSNRSPGSPGSTPAASRRPRRTLSARRSSGSNAPRPAAARCPPRPAGCRCRGGGHSTTGHRRGGGEPPCPNRGTRRPPTPRGCSGQPHRVWRGWRPRSAPARSGRGSGNASQHPPADRDQVPGTAGHRPAQSGAPLDGEGVGRDVIRVGLNARSTVETHMAEVSPGVPKMRSMLTWAIPAERSVVHGALDVGWSMTSPQCIEDHRVEGLGPHRHPGDPDPASPSANSAVTSSGLTSIDTSHPGARPLWKRRAAITDPSSLGATRDGVPPPKATASRAPTAHLAPTRSTERRRSARRRRPVLLPREIAIGTDSGAKRDVDIGAPPACCSVRQGRRVGGGVKKVDRGHDSTLRAAMNASWGTSTDPTIFIRSCLPSDAPAASASW